MKTHRHFEVRYLSSNSYWVTICHDAGSIERAREIVAESRETNQAIHQILKVVTTTEAVE